MSSTAGQVDFPAHTKLFNQDLLYGDPLDATTEATYAAATDTPDTFGWNISFDTDAARSENLPNDNPHSNSAAPSPDDDLAKMVDALDDVGGALGDLDAEATITAYVDAHESTVDTIILTDAAINEAVNAFDTKSKPPHLRGTTRVAASLFDVRSVMSSTYGGAMANHELARAQEVDDYRAKLQLQQSTQRSEAVLQLVRMSAQTEQFRIQGLGTHVQTNTAVAQKKYELKAEQIQYDLARDIDDTLWNLNLYTYPLAGASAMQGIPLGPLPPTKFERIASSVLAIGSLIATIV